MNKFWENLKTTNERVEIHCKTEKEAEDFCKHAYEHGFYWGAGPASHGTRWQFVRPLNDIYYTLDPSCVPYIDFDGVHNPNITSTVEWSDYM